VVKIGMASKGFCEIRITIEEELQITPIRIIKQELVAKDELHHW
jgi:hypothetical protein